MWKTLYYMKSFMANLIKWLAICKIDNILYIK